MSDDDESVTFDDLVALGLAAAASGPQPGPLVRQRLMTTIAASAEPAGFTFHHASDDRWLPHAVPGIRMKVLALNQARGYATLLLDVAPGTRFPSHHHGGAEECFVVSGSIFTCGRRLGPGDFVHAEADTDHGELWTEEGAQVILIVPPEEHLPAGMLT
ncbi:MAG: cupin domain-containing protein [Vicinamibacterales bacterium]